MTTISPSKKKILNVASVPPERCVFCNIVSRKVPSYIVYEDDSYIAFLDSAPFNKGHTLVSPKKHGETLWDMTEDEIGGLFTRAARISKAIVEATAMDGFRLVQNNGEAANQVVAHVHVHIIPSRMEDKGRWMDRKKFTPEQMRAIAEEIRRALSNLEQM